MIRRPPRRYEWKPEKVPNPAELLGKSYFNAITNPWKQLEVAAQGCAGFGQGAEGAGGEGLHRQRAPCWRRAPASIARSARTAWSRAAACKLADIKAIRRSSPGCEGQRRVPRDGRRCAAQVSARQGRSARQDADRDGSDLGPRGRARRATWAIRSPRWSRRWARISPIRRNGWPSSISQTANSKAMSDAIGARNMTEMPARSRPHYVDERWARSSTRASGSPIAARRAPFSTVVTNVPGPPVPIHFQRRAAREHDGAACA
jgi:diacylglycerol O-acyltransferase